MVLLIWWDATHNWIVQYRLRKIKLHFIIFIQIICAFWIVILSMYLCTKCQVISVITIIINWNKQAVQRYLHTICLIESTHTYTHEHTEYVYMEISRARIINERNVQNPLARYECLWLEPESSRVPIIKQSYRAPVSLIHLLLHCLRYATRHPQRART